MSGAIYEINMICAVDYSRNTLNNTLIELQIAFISSCNLKAFLQISIFFPYSLIVQDLYALSMVLADILILQGIFC